MTARRDVLDRTTGYRCVVERSHERTPDANGSMQGRTDVWALGGCCWAVGTHGRLSRCRSRDRLLANRSSQPHHCPHRLAAGRIAMVEQFRRQRQTGPAIARALVLARSTVGLEATTRSADRPSAVVARLLWRARFQVTAWRPRRTRRERV